MTTLNSVTVLRFHRFPQEVVSPTHLISLKCSLLGDTLTSMCSQPAVKIVFNNKFNNFFTVTPLISIKSIETNPTFVQTTFLLVSWSSTTSTTISLQVRRYIQRPRLFPPQPLPQVGIVAVGKQFCRSAVQSLSIQRRSVEATCRIHLSCGISGIRVPRNQFIMYIVIQSYLACIIASNIYWSVSNSNWVVNYTTANYAFEASAARNITCSPAMEPT